MPAQKINGLAITKYMKIVLNKINTCRESAPIDNNEAKRLLVPKYFVRKMQFSVGQGQYPFM